MSRAYRTLRHALVIMATTGLSVGCSAITQTTTVEASDTYQHWSDKMDHMPFLFHLPDGRTEAFDDHGKAWADAGSHVETSGADRVEVYVGNFPGPSDTLCAVRPKAQPAGATANDANVVSALCDQSRTVVSFSDHVRPRVLAATGDYVGRVRHLLLNGIWKSVAQEPDPRPY
jgi:predicted ABC-class ATPase